MAAKKKAVKKKVKKKSVRTGGATRKNALSGKKRVIFSLHAPSASEVCLVGSFNEWDAGRHMMKKNASGEWSKTVYIEPGEYEYKFLVDGEWTTDPQCDRTVHNEFGTLNNLLVVTA